MRRIAVTLCLMVAAGTGLAASAGADDAHEYKVEMYNAFGIVQGSDVRISGVNAGTVTDLDINEDKRALISIELSGDLGTLGEETTCSAEPQSLIAEYFIDCEPMGPALDDGGTIPAERVTQTVQPDLVQNTLREPFKRRLQLLINEFGTALAGNPEALNEAIRLGAPALRQLREVTKILASQNRIIRDLNVNSDRVIGRLAERRDDVVRFVQEARDTAEISASRREDLSRNFEILDDFLFELRPTLAQLETLAREQVPLLTNLRGAAPGLTQLSENLPAFNEASQVSLDTLGEASQVGETALRRGADEIEELAAAGKKAPIVGEMLADLLRDLDDPRRAVEIDDRAARDTGRDNPEPGQRDTKGYTGLEGLLNYVYYQPGALNQFDEIGHMLHFSLYFVNSGPCGHFSTGVDEEGVPGLPAEGGGTTTEFGQLADCVATLGPNIPGVNDFFELPKFDPSVCPNGTEPERAREELCDPAGSQSARAEAGAGAGQGGRGDGEALVPGGDGGTTGAGDGSAAGDGSQGPVSDDILDDILDDLPADALDDLPGNLGNTLNQGQTNGGGGGGGGAAGAGATGDLLDFLFKS